MLESCLGEAGNGLVLVLEIARFDCVLEWLGLGVVDEVGEGSPRTRLTRTLGSNGRGRYSSAMSGIDDLFGRRRSESGSSPRAWWPSSESLGWRKRISDVEIGRLSVGDSKSSSTGCTCSDSPVAAFDEERCECDNGAPSAVRYGDGGIERRMEAGDAPAPGLARGAISVCDSAGNSFGGSPNDSCTPLPLAPALASGGPVATLGTVVLLHRDFGSGTIGGAGRSRTRFFLLFSDGTLSELWREVVKSRNDVTPSDVAGDGPSGGVGAWKETLVSRKGWRELPCTNSDARKRGPALPTERSDVLGRRSSAVDAAPNVLRAGL